jgi:4-amino-4-deoxy-L-arabinose transferase-like glycosyltransferase
MFLFQLAGSSTVGIILAVAFLLVFVGLAAFAFFMIRKTVKMAIRMLIVGLILLIAAVGSFALWYGIGSSPSPSNRPNRPSANAR